MSLELDAYIAKQRGLSYGQFMALTDGRERAKLHKQFRKEFDKAQKHAHVKTKKKTAEK